MVVFLLCYKKFHQLKSAKTWLADSQFSNSHIRCILTQKNLINTLNIELYCYIISFLEINCSIQY